MASDKLEIHAGDLPGEIRTMAGLIGLKATLTLIEKYSGDSLYFPKIETITRAARDRTIKEEFTGSNYKDLARKYNLTSKHVRCIISGKSIKN
jgi:Mor family transcriptional regulator